VYVYTEGNLIRIARSVNAGEARDPRPVTNTGWDTSHTAISITTAESCPLPRVSGTLRRRVCVCGCGAVRLGRYYFPRSAHLSGVDSGRDSSCMRFRARCAGKASRRATFSVSAARAADHGQVPAAESGQSSPYRHVRLPVLWRGPARARVAAEVRFCATPGPNLNALASGHDLFAAGIALERRAYGSLGKFFLSNVFISSPLDS
jgi:hypothetical protein